MGMTQYTNERPRCSCVEPRWACALRLGCFKFNEFQNDLVFSNSFSY